MLDGIYRSLVKVPLIEYSYLQRNVGIKFANSLTWYIIVILALKGLICDTTRTNKVITIQIGW